jgi:hypothetical protein
MSFEKVISIISRIFFILAFILLGLAVIERVANFYDYTILAGVYAAGRLLEFSVVLLLFVLALQLREVREALRPRRP